MIHVARGDQAPAAADLVAEAFADLAATAWLVPDAGARPDVLRENFRILVAHAVDHGEIHLVEDGSAVAVWFFRDSGAATPPPPDYDERLVAACGPWTNRFRLLDDLFEANHPGRSHHHLAFLAVRPDRQGQGLGTELLRHHHRCLDERGTAAYLEASSEGSRDLYARHGYALRDPFLLPDGTVFWPMWREPGRS